MAKAAKDMAELLERQAAFLASSGLIGEAEKAREEARQLRLYAAIEEH